MSLRSVRIPKYRHHKGSGQAFVQFKGERFYLGKHGTEESQERYRRFIAENITPNRPAVVTPVSLIDGITVVELIAAYWQFAEGYYVKNGQPTDHLHTVRRALAVARDLYGHDRAAEFGPLSFQAIQAKLTADGLSRGYINSVCSAIRRMFKWGVNRELLPVTTYQALATVPGLKKGRTEARETAPVGPVADEVVDATLPYLPSVVATMVRLQRLSGARPGEICALRPMEIDRTGDIWKYTPSSHKTEHRGRERIVYFGPQAQALLTPYLLRPANSFCFSPQEVVKNLHETRRTRRKTPLSGNRPASRKRKGKREPGDRYITRSYCHSVHRAVARANRDRKKEGQDPLPRWSPNRLRHAAGTEVRKKFGLEASQTVLGHAKANTTEIYAQRDQERAIAVMRAIG